MFSTAAAAGMGFPNRYAQTTKPARKDGHSTYTFMKWFYDLSGTMLKNGYDPEQNDVKLILHTETSDHHQFAGVQERTGQVKDYCVIFNPDDLNQVILMYKSDVSDERRREAVDVLTTIGTELVTNQLIVEDRGRPYLEYCGKEITSLSEMFENDEFCTMLQSVRQYF